MSTDLNTETLYPRFEALPEYVEAAAREIFEALHTFLPRETLPNPNGGPDLPWVSEIRIPVARETNPKTGKTYTNVEAAWFDKPGIEDIAAELASHWCQPPHLPDGHTKYAEGGIYWTINPITQAYLDNYGSRLERRKTGTARDVDVIARYWLPIDADALRKDPITGAPLGVVSSTDAEKANIAQLIAQVREYLVGDLGWPEPVRVDTGNGYADFYALPGIPIPRCPDPDIPGCLKYDAANDTLIRDVIHALGHKFSNALGSIDDAVFNPSRIMKVPGTWARKAKHTSTRPHRASRIVYTPPAIVPVNLDQLQRVADQLAKTTTKAKTRPAGTPVRLRVPGDTQPGASRSPVSDAGGPGPVEPTDEAERADRINCARNYLVQVPHAISGVCNENGQKGHDATFVGLGKAIRRFALTREMAEEAVIDWNSRCEPPWSDAELAHKLDSIYADSRGADDWGLLLNNAPDIWAEEDVTAEEAARNREAYRRAKRRAAGEIPEEELAELKSYVDSSELISIIEVYEGDRVANIELEPQDTGTEAPDPASSLYGLYCAVRGEPHEPRVVKKWSKDTVPAHLRAAWWKHWQQQLYNYRRGRTKQRAKTRYTDTPELPYITNDNHEICVVGTRVDEEGNPRTVYMPVCNFDAKITTETTVGNTLAKEYTIRATRLHTGEIISKEIVVPAAKFEAMGWVAEQLGAEWSIVAGRGNRDQLRDAIQRLSAQAGVVKCTKYNHTGWVRHNGADYYLHAGGVIGASGTVGTSDIGFVVDLDGALPLYKLPDPPADSQLVDDVRAVLRLRDLGRTGRPNAQGIAAALVALPWRAVLGACNFAVVLAGGSGGGKTTLGCLPTQHFGPEHTYDSDHQAPTTWEATAAHIEWLAHRAKDSVLFVDNFIADSTQLKSQQAKAATILNNQGDLRARERMGPDMRPLPSLPPRGGLLSTGEDTAARNSAKGRSLLVQVTRGGDNPGSVDYATLTPLQRDAAAGAYARATAAYIRHVAAAGLDRYARRLKELTVEFRDRAIQADVRGHARTPAILGALAAGYQLFLEWAENLGAIRCASEAVDEHWRWLLTLAPVQAEEMEESDDALRWRSLVHSALTCGRAYLAGPDGKAPSTRQAECGWHQETAWKDRDGKSKVVECWAHSNTARIGWFDGANVYLDEHEVMALVQSLATQQNHILSQPATIKARLAERGWLQTSQEGGKTRYAVRSSIELEGARRRAWKLSLAHFWPE